MDPEKDVELGDLLKATGKYNVSSMSTGPVLNKHSGTAVKFWKHFGGANERCDLCA